MTQMEVCAALVEGLRKNSITLGKPIWKTKVIQNNETNIFISFTPYSVSFTNFSVLSLTLLNAPEFPNFPYIGRLYDRVIAVSSAQHPAWLQCLSSFLSGKYWKFFPSDSDLSHFHSVLREKMFDILPLYGWYDG